MSVSEKHGGVCSVLGVVLEIVVQASIIRRMSFLHAIPFSFVDVTIVADSCVRGTSDIVQLNLMRITSIQPRLDLV